MSFHKTKKRIPTKLDFVKYITPVEPGGCLIGLSHTKKVNQDSHAILGVFQTENVLKNASTSMTIEFCIFAAHKKYTNYHRQLDISTEGSKHRTLLS